MALETMQRRYIDFVKSTLCNMLAQSKRECQAFGFASSCDEWRLALVFFEFCVIGVAHVDVLLREALCISMI